MTINQFKFIAFWEGISLILLLFFAMPLKHIFDFPIFVKVIGMAHGLLFVLYVFFALYLKFRDDWENKKTIFILLASLIPFGTFYMERKYFANA